MITRTFLSVFPQASLWRGDFYPNRAVVGLVGQRSAEPVDLARLGDARWIFVEGEHYHWLQTELRRHFPGVPLLVTTVVNGSRCTYLPTATSYGKGIYQESIAVLEKGCLERLADVLGEQIRQT